VNAVHTVATVANGHPCQRNDWNWQAAQNALTCIDRDRGSTRVESERESRVAMATVATLSPVRMDGNRQTLRDPPARGNSDSPPSIQNQSPWVRDGESICPDCGWSTNTIGHEVNCEETP
jgi:hypothetical protein